MQRDILGYFRCPPPLSGLRVELAFDALAVVFVVEQHDGAQIPEHTVVHVRRGNRNVAQRRCLELARLHGVVDIRVVQQTAVDVIGRRAVDRTRGLVNRHADVVILVAAEGFAGTMRRRFELVAEVAVGELLREEERHAQLFQRCHLVFTAQIAVVFGIEGCEVVGLLEGGDALRHCPIGSLRLIEDAGAK